MLRISNLSARIEGNHTTLANKWQEGRYPDFCVKRPEMLHALS